jgi:CheY-like chemotaxis protein
MSLQNPKESVLYVGAYQPLVLTRAQILREAGYDVFTAHNVAEATAAVTQRSLDIVLICHSFTLEERSQIASVVERLAPSAMILSLTDAYNSIMADPPDTFLAVVKSAARQAHSRSA